ncbi:hypothetical protein IQ274_29615 [Nostoc sp. LEGE 12447]|nr:hypothetical protein [Nostoc sp. LEGE 12447]
MYLREIGRFKRLSSKT